MRVIDLEHLDTDVVKQQSSVKVEEHCLSRSENQDWPLITAKKCKSSDEGIGIYAVKDIKSNTIVCDYYGKTVLKKEYDQDSLYGLKYRDFACKEWIVDAKDCFKSKGRYINFSKEHFSP